MGDAYYLYKQLLKAYICERSIDVENATITNLIIRKNFKITCQEGNDLN